MASVSCIIENSTIKEIRLLHRKPWTTWLTVWPFVILYAVSFTLYFYPEIVWSRVTYLVHQTYIDFFHAACFPFIIFFHAFVALFTIWSVKFRAAILYRTVQLECFESATDVLIVTHEHRGESEIVELRQESEEGNPPCFIFQQRKWKWCDKDSVFVKPHFPTKESFSHYLYWKGLDTTTDCPRQLDMYGSNKMEVIIPEFHDLFVDHAFSPFFVFQMFCVLLWCLDEYWYYSCFTGVMMVVMESMTVYQRIRNMRTLRDMAEVPVQDVQVIRDGKQQTIKTTALLPMDLMVVPNNQACPVDAVLVKGTCVVNEAMLTGESTPQLKEAPGDLNIPLDLKKHARHMLFSGTQILLGSGPKGGAPEEGQAMDDEESSSKGKCSGGNALAVVVKTGFETKQGKLLRTILHSQGRVSENSSEAFAFIGVLVVFALAASGYLLKHGLADPRRGRWKLFLSCIQVVTSVVPPELPMELSLAVNVSLLALSKLSVFCTEPFRIPFAGMVDTCCFDKTGTLTTDEMLFGGVDMVDGKGILTKLHDIPKHASMILGTCHSLVYLDENTLAGDAMEKAAVITLGYRMDADDNILHCPPKTPNDSEKSPQKQTAGGDGEHAAKNGGPERRFRILVRFPFLAPLRRMSCVMSAPDGKYVVAKGSPDAIAALCEDVPPHFHETTERIAAQGFRVIALAFRRLTSEEGVSKERAASLKREEAEAHLRFAGIAVYVCPLKKDARETIGNLVGGTHRCVIITGDSVQTAICVGRDVGLLQCEHQLVARPRDDGVIEWADAVTGEVEQGDAQCILSRTFVYTKKNQRPLERQWDICVDAEGMRPEVFSAIVRDFNEYVAVWARCAPTQKEEIVTDLKLKKHIVMMAGDGTNDVGALKQAHAGIAVLNSSSMQQKDESAKNVLVGPQPHSEPDVPADLLVPPNFKFTVLPPPPSIDSPFMETMRFKLAEAKRKAEIVQIRKWNDALKAAAKVKAEAKSAAPPPPPQSGPAADGNFLMESLFNADDEGMGGPPMIKLGDASIAAPFTCRSKALTSVCDIVRLGRSTLVTTHTMYKILALNCLNSAYSMSVLHIAGVKAGEKQMVLSGMILSICFVLMSRNKPLPHLCPQRPVTRVFHPYMTCTVFLQFAVHLFCMIQTSRMVAEVDHATMLEMQKDIDKKFKPTLLNSTMFLMTTLMSGAIFAVNYRGEPFMEGLRRNRPLLIALIILAVLILGFASESNPEANELFEIVTFPSEDFRTRFTYLLLFDVIGTFLVEKACLMVFTDY